MAKNPPGSVSGPVKLGKSTKKLIQKLLPGDIAVVDHEDIDRLSADSLIRSGVAAVINAASCVSGRFPNLAPQMLLDAGILVVDKAGQAIFEELNDGDLVEISGSVVLKDGQELTRGVLLSSEILKLEYSSATGNINQRLEEFVDNTADYLKQEGAQIIYDCNPPDIGIDMRGRQALVVVRGPDFREDLFILRSYINEVKPLIVAVDGAADALIENGNVPDVIVGDMDSVSDSALACGAKIVAHAYEDGNCPSAERLDSLGVDYLVWPLAATSEDLALLLAWEGEAELIVAVGTHSNLIEYMEKDRRGMASTFLVRLRVGTKLVDAKGVSKLYRPSPPGRYVFLVILCALVAIMAAVFISEPLRNTLAVMWLTLRTYIGF